MALTDRFSFAVAPGGRVSIHPLAPVTFWTSDGLKYPLDAVKLASGGADGDVERGADRAVHHRAGGGDACPVPADPAAGYLMPLIAKLLLEKPARQRKAPV